MKLTCCYRESSRAEDGAHRVSRVPDVAGQEGATFEPVDTAGSTVKEVGNSV